MNLKTILYLVLICVCAGPTLGQVITNKDSAKQMWIDSIYGQMSLDEKIGQLMVLRAHSNKGQDHIDKVTGLVKKYQLGGLCFFQGTPAMQAKLLNVYQKQVKVPMMISMDAEWGLSMRLKKETIEYPRQLMLGAISDNRLIYQMGQAVAKECQRLGVHMNYAPVVDINNNPNNPVINTRSFGEDKYNVTTKSYAYMKGMQDGGILACAKHFPGHGDTDTDSHLDLPVINHDMNRLDSIEMFPFKVLVNQGIKSVMVAHLHVPEIDSTENLPTTLSKTAVTDILKDSMGFKGLVITDGLGMKGVTKYYKPGQVEAEALVAGNDLLLLPQSVPDAFKSIKEYLGDGRITEDRLGHSVKKMLAAKYDLKLTQWTDVVLQNLKQELNDPAGIKLKKELIENALTLVNNTENVVPLGVDKSKVMALSIGAPTTSVFQAKLGSYIQSNNIAVSKALQPSEVKRIKDGVAVAETVVISLHDLSSYASKDFGINKNMIDLINGIAENKKVLLVHFGNPYALKYFQNLKNIVVSYNEDVVTEEATAKAIVGTLPFLGHLPVSIKPAFHFNDGVVTNPFVTLRYGNAQSVGFDEKILQNIDGLAKEAIRKKATPGCQVLVAKNNQIVYNKTFGHFTYKKKRKLVNGDLFDLASVTKVAATTLSLMKLYDEGLVDIERPVSDYLTDLQGTNKDKILVKDLMTHHAKLIGWIPFYKETVEGDKNPKPKASYYKNKRDNDFSIKVTDDLFLMSSYRDSIWNKIIDSDLRSKEGYRYSDLGFYILAKLVFKVSGKPLDKYVHDEFYAPMGLTNTYFKPLNKIGKENIVPSEKDKYFRKGVIQGYVHDMGAAMMGGVSGHAGLFSDAEGLAKIYTLFLNKGLYGDKRYISESVFNIFAHRPGGMTRRGIGFDMKELNEKKLINMAEEASDETFGHLGFTGISAWVDPKHDLIYIFLSNRTYPTMENKKLLTLDTRPKIQAVLYKALGEG